MTRKSQAALEFLVTYSWAFLAILITMASLYYFGILDFQKYLPERCLFTSQLECVDFVMKYDDQEIIIKLSNNLGEQINVQSLSITNDAASPLGCLDPTSDPSWNPTWDPGVEKDIIFAACSGGGFLENERIDAKVTITYFAPATTPITTHTVNGKIQARVQ